MEFRLLGPLEVLHDGRPLSVGGTREREVLTLLLLAPNRVVSADRLVEDMWAGRPPEGAIQALRVFVSRLRRALREAGEDDVVQTRAPGYLARVDPMAIDSVRFEASLAAARAATSAGDHAEAAAALGAALALWRGPALGDVANAPMARAEAARLEEIRLGALEERIAADLACGRHADVIAELEGLTRAQPLRERLWAARMLALYRCGRQAEALRAYSEVRTILGEELGLEPGVELARLESAILRHDEELNWRLAPDVAPVEAVPTGSAMAPAAAPAVTRPTRLPDSASSLAAGSLDEGPMTILFTDVEGSTDLRTRRGDHEAQRLLSAHEEIVRAQIAAHRGREVKALGDGFMVAFSSARRALACAVGIQRALAGRPGEAPAVQVRIGLNTGEVLRDGADLYGQAVHAAARIAAHAAGGEILISELVKQLVGSASGLTFADRGRHRLKGFPDRWRLFAVDWTTEDGPRFAVQTPYVGRIAERDELGRLLQGALDGRGGLAMIGGEAGVGKTRLTQEVSAQASLRGARTRVGRCYETDGAPPYVPFVEMLEQALESSPSPHAFRELLGEHAPEVARLVPRLRRLFPDLPPPLDLPAEQERRHLFNSIRDFLAHAAAVAPVVLVFDDLHWADEPTLLLLEHLAERLADLPVLAIGTYRDNEVDGRPALARTLDGLIRRNLMTRITLRRLPEDDVGDLLVALSGRRPPPALVRLIHSQTDGNPFFVEEIFKHLAEEGRLFDSHGEFHPGITGKLDVPETLRLVLGRRLDHLAPPTRRTLDSAAIVGRAFTFDLLEAMGDAESDDLLDALEEAERARLVTPVSADERDPRMLFAHELIRQTILAGLSRPRRQRLHLRAAHAIEHLHRDALDVHASEVADHLTRAGHAAEPGRLLHHLTLAGRHAMSTASFEDALRHFEQALTLAQMTSPVTAAQMQVDVALARRSLGRLPEAHDAWRQAIDGFEALGDHEAMAQACAGAAEDLLWCNRDQEGFDLALRGLAALGEAATPLRARMLGWAAGTGGWIAPYEVADKLSGDAIALARSLGDDRLLGQALINDAALRFAFYQQSRTAESGEHARELLEGTRDLWNMARAWAAPAKVELGDYSGAAASSGAIREVGQQLGQFAAVWCANWADAPGCLGPHPDLDRFEANAREAVEIAAGLNFESVALPRLGLTAFLRGDWDAAAAISENATRHELTNRLRGMAWGPMLQLRAYRGERAAALEILDQERENLPRPGVPNAYGSWQFLAHAIEGLSVLGEREPALRDRCAALYPLAREFAASGIVLMAFQGRLTERLAAMAAAAGRNWDAAERHFAAALRQAADLPNRLEDAEIRRFHAAMLLHRDAGDDRPRAARMLAEAQARYAEIGMPRHVVLVRAALALEPSA